MTLWACQYEYRGRWRVRVFDTLTDCDAFRERAWRRGIDPEYWQL